MGFLGELFDELFDEFRDQNLGGFERDGVVFKLDNLKLPWVYISRLELPCEENGYSHAIELFGGITISVEPMKFNDDKQSGYVDDEDAYKYFEHAQATEDYPKTCGIDNILSQDYDCKVIYIGQLWNLIVNGFEVINQLKNTVARIGVEISYKRLFDNYFIIVKLYFDIIESLKGERLREFEKEWKERVLGIVCNYIKCKVFEDIDSLNNNNQDEDKQVAGFYCEALVRLGGAGRKAYDYLRLSSKLGHNGTLVKSRVETCLARKRNEIGRPTFEKTRRVIVCTKEIGRVANESEVEMDALITTAEDMETYNSLVSANLRLRFMSTHPRNGCTYIQYPFDKNQYFEVNEFHDMVRERKQNELLRLLESLGAYSAKVEVRHTMQVRDNYNASYQTNGNGSGICGAEIQGSLMTGEEIQKTSLRAQTLAKEYTFNPPDEAAIPQDLVFFPQEESWQNIAKSVLRGGMKHASVDLEYKTEYGINEKFLSELSASFKALIPSYEMNLKQEFSIGLEKLTTTQWHYDVSFEDEKGKRAGKGKIKILPCESGGLPDKAEGLFLKRARRYAQSDRRMDEEQREDLETFAKKYGIDGFRMEELIEEAFE